MSTTRSWPTRIFLQRDEPYEWAQRGEETTWCQDKINEHDVEYVRIDLFNSLKAQLKKGAQSEEEHG